MIFRLALLKIFFLLLLYSCQQRKTTRFTRLSADETGIAFANPITESDSLNIFTYEYIYNGGGVGAGDLNSDGLTDLFFAGSMVSSKLYLNKGGFSFLDITNESGTATPYWCTGVAIADINQDGKLDIYVNTAFPFKNITAPNLLFINQGNNKDGIPVFKEQAALVGLNDSSYGTQSAFFDYDLDGDLDVYLCINSVKESDRNALTGQRKDGTGPSQDKLFRNDGIDSSTGLPHFTNVSKEAGIQTEGWGLGVIVKDINRDGWPDVYVANDFQSNDHLYINNRNGTFSNHIDKYIAHQSHNSMGVDMADCNNDGLEDICVVDMLPEDNLRQKTMFGAIPNDKYEKALRMGYQPQFVRNVLQLNTGLLPDSTHDGYAFSDIGYMAGIAATDWSWSPLWADLDNDGWRDLLITNGYVKDITDLDFTTFVSEYNMFGDADSKMKRIRQKAKEMGEVKKPNWLFMNNHNLGFVNKAMEDGLIENTFTNGTVYADLDNDGDLDIAMNNLNDDAFVYRNNTISTISKNDSANYLAVKLAGSKGNYEGIGAKVSIWYNGQMQYAEHTAQRGYLSNTDSRIYFGLGKVKMIDSIRVQWLYGTSQTIKNVSANQLLVVEEKNATPFTEPVKIVASTYFTEKGKELGLDNYTHTENEYMDFNYQYTIPHRFSMQGPSLAVADINGDGLDDVYAGAASRQSGYFFIQNKSGFTVRQATADPSLKLQEETGTLLFDADNDGDNDLYCVAGGNEFGDSASYQDLFFINDGKGNFTASPVSLPNTTASGSCIIGADYDHDGDIDLFIGGRTKPHQYPLSSRSYLLRNDTDPASKKVLFTDVTGLMCKEMTEPGMVTSALWTDYDNDNFPDLLMAGEFMPVSLFRNNGGKIFELLSIADFKNTNGWYNSLCAADFDSDGDMDFVAGNLGFNSKYKANINEPVTVRYNDYNRDGALDAFLFSYNNHIEYPVHTRTTATEQVTALRKRMYYYNDYGKAGYHELFNDKEREGAKEIKAYQMASLFIENKGNGNFKVKELPLMAQTAPMFGITATDVDGDGNLDIVATGNSYATEAWTGRYDASLGWVLKNDGNNDFSYIYPQNSGFIIGGDVRSLVKVNFGNQKCLWIAGRNKESLKVFEPGRNGKCYPVKKDDIYIVYTFSNGKKRKEELFYGSTYLSQSGRFIQLQVQATSAVVYNLKEKERTIQADGHNAGLKK